MDLRCFGGWIQLSSRIAMKQNIETTISKRPQFGSGMKRGGCLLAFGLIMSLWSQYAFAAGATFSESGSTLNLAFDSAGRTVTITSLGSSYTFVLQSGTWTGTNSSNVTGNGTATLTVTSAGTSAFTTGINVVDGTFPTQTVNFATSLTNNYFNSIFVNLNSTGCAINFNGTTAFSAPAFLTANANGTLTVATSASVSSGNSVTLQATGALTMGSFASVNGTNVTLAADTLANGNGDNGVGILTLNASASVMATNITLRGADIDILSGATVGSGSTTALKIQSSVVSRPMSIGGTNNAVAGINLTDSELVALTTSAVVGSITFGDPTQTGDIRFETAIPATAFGAGVQVTQAAGGAGAIHLDTGGIALDNINGPVTLGPGTGGIFVGQAGVDTSLRTQGYNCTGQKLTLTLSQAPMIGGQIKIIDNTSGNPITGNFASLGQGGTITAMFSATTYTFVANYSGGDGNDLVLTSVGPPTAVTQATSAISTVAATFNGSITANGLNTNVSFQYGLTTGYGQTAGFAAGPVTGTTPTPVNVSVSGLLPGTLYHVRVVATNTAGTTFGSDTTFTTGSAQFVDNSSTLDMSFAASNETISIMAQPTTYTLMLTKGIWFGTDTSNVTGNGTPVLTVTVSGRTAFFGGMTITDAAQTGSTVNFVNSTANQYVTSMSIALQNAGSAINFSGMTTFSGANISMDASSGGNLTVMTGASVIANGTSSGITLQAKGNVTVTDCTISAVLGVQLAADVDFNTNGDDGVGTLQIAGTSSILGGDLTLIGADIEISGTSSVGNTSTTTIGIQSSVLTRPMSIGGANNAVTGVNLTDIELARLVTNASGKIRFGSTDSLYTGDIRFVTATPATTPGAGIEVKQDPTSSAKISLDTGGIVLNGNGGLVMLFPGTGGVVVGQALADISLRTQGFNASGKNVVLTLNAMPAQGAQIKIIDNTSANPINGTFSNLAPGGTITADFNAVTYTFVANYSGGDGNDLVLTALGAPTVTTQPATAVGATGATLNGTVNANGASTTISFDYGTSIGYGQNMGATPSPLTGSVTTSVLATVSGLLPNTLYHYRAVGVNSQGTTNGGDQTFTTPNNDATLTNLTISRGVLSPAFNNATPSYSVFVPQTLTSVALTAFLTDSNATLTINGVTTASGVASAPIALSSTTPIPVIVTAQDGTTQKSFTVVVTQLNLPTTTTTVTNAFSQYSANAQSISISATLTPSSGTVNDGDVTFQVMDGANPVGSPIVSGTVTSNSATALYPIPAALSSKTYTIVATYGHTNSFDISSDSTHTLTISPATTTLATTPASVVYSGASQNVTLSATASSSAGALNAGTISFQILDGATPIGGPVVSSTVVQGGASVSYSVPGGTAAKVYTIRASYSGSTNFAGIIDSTQTLTITPGMTVTTADDAAVEFSSNARSVWLLATVTPTSGGTANEGNVVFTIMQNGNTIGNPSPANGLSNGVAAVNFLVPAGQEVGTYMIFAAYAGGPTLGASMDNTHTLTVTKSTTVTTLYPANFVFSASDQSVTLNAAVNSHGNVNEGTVNFQTTFGTVNSGTVVGGTASVQVTIPGNTAIGNYAVTTTYSGTTRYNTSVDSIHTISVTSGAPNEVPVVPALKSDQNPNFPGQTVFYTFTATDTDTATLDYTFDWGDGTALVSGSFPQGTFVTVSHDYDPRMLDTTVTLSVTDRIIATPVTQTILQLLPQPDSGGTGIPNTLQGGDPIVTPVTVPMGGLSQQVINSEGGVIQLAINDANLTLVRTSNYDLTTDWGDTSGRKSTGNLPVHNYSTRGIYVAKTLANIKNTNVLAGKARITLPLSSKETGDFPPNVANYDPKVLMAAAPADTGIVMKSLKGKFAFNALKADLVTFSGSIKLPAGFTVGQPHEFYIGIGNIVVMTTLDKNGKGAVPGTPAVLKSLKLTTKVKKGVTTVGGEAATVTVTYSTKNMVANGFDTEGISAQATDVGNGKTAPRNIQVAILLDGSPYQMLAPVDYKLSGKSDLGNIAGRKNLP